MVRSTVHRPEKPQRLGLQHFAATIIIHALRFWSWAAYLCLPAGCAYCLAHILECSDGPAEGDDFNLDLTCRALPPLFAIFGTTTAGMLVRFCVEKLRQRMSNTSKTHRRAQKHKKQEDLGTSKKFKKGSTQTFSKTSIHHATRNVMRPKSLASSSFSSKTTAVRNHKRPGKRSLLGRKGEEAFMMRLQDSPKTFVVGEEVWLGRGVQW